MQNSSCWNTRCWHIWLALMLAVASCTSLSAQKRASDIPMPTEFEIGRHTYFDFGPPTDYYELFVVRSRADGTTAERITLTPYASCLAPAKIEVAHATFSDSVAALLGNRNPCGIPERDLRRERKRCKHCMNFSGADIAMQVPCGTGNRLIRSDVLERDWFDPSAHTPKQTSWAMNFLGKLDEALGPTVMDKPAVSTPILGSPSDSQPSPLSLLAADVPIFQELAAGKYDALFSGPDKASELYRAAQNPPPAPTIELVSSKPYMPDSFLLPPYPLIARLAGIDALVSFATRIDANGSPVQAVNYIPNQEPQADLTFENGAPYLQPAIRATVAKWHFPKDAIGQQVHVVLRFTSNCPKKTD